MNKLWATIFCLLALSATRARADFLIARGAKAQCVIICQSGATAAEAHAAAELAMMLGRITGARFSVQSQIQRGQRAIVIGPGEIAAQLFPDVALDDFAAEELTIRVRGRAMLLAGGRPRGTLYAVSRFLQEQCGVRWWTPWATDIPRRADLRIAAMSLRDRPAFEYREPFWFAAFDGPWAARHFYNGQSARLTAELGDKITYKGFVHTFYPLVPPEKYFGAHPEWYSLVDGKRKSEGAQLCLSNGELRDFVVEQVRQLLRESPQTDIVSVSQNDCFGACQCDKCRAIDDAEGSPSGSLIAFVNYVAQKIEAEFPRVAIDTLAYQYTRRPPKTLRPRANVIVRLCSIEGNFAAPLNDASNATFANDLRDWGKICRRLYIWDYTTDFAHYVQPHPNWFSLGANVRFFAQNGVKGVFEEGAYQSHGAEMAPLRGWLLAKLLWNPAQNDRLLIAQFLRGYFGRAAPFVARYLELMHAEANGYYLSWSSPTDAPFLRFASLSQAEKLWQQAEAAVKTDPDKLWRVRQEHLAVRYVWLTRWTMLQREAVRAGQRWPLPSSRRAVADEWLHVATDSGPVGWSRMTHLNESGLTPEAFVARFAKDPAEPIADPRRLNNPPAPADLPAALVANSGGVDAQEEMAKLYREGELSEMRADNAASDGAAVWMPGDHHEWAFQLPIDNLPVRAQSGRWKVYAVIRVQKKAATASASQAAVLTAGIYDAQARVGRAEIAVSQADAAEQYRSYLLGQVDFKPGQYIWIAPASNPAIEAIWVDRIYLLPVK